jgi:hypothetical protein
MSKILRTVLIFGLTLIQGYSWSQISLDYEANKTPEWHEVIEMYSILDESYKNASLVEVGLTDAGKPLHLFIISDSEVFSADELHQADKRIIMINNGIHPGESNGIDASLDFAADLLSGELQMKEFLENTVIIIVPIFNVGGALNRNAYNRANQNGPEEHGFRANARNLDLNRDFVKMDSRNALSLVKVIHEWDPDVFIDTHSTNGADYPYTVTLIASHPQQLEEPQSSFLQQKMESYLYKVMNDSPYKMCHYVNVYNSSPENGFEGFYEYPRYLAGYTSSFHMLSFTVETHMLKPYAERVLSTKYLLREFLKFTSQNSGEIKENKDRAITATMAKKEHVIKWEIDVSKLDHINFTGYEAKYERSSLTGKRLIHYDTEKTWTKEIPYYNTFKPVTSVDAPDYYIVPAAWREVIERLQSSHIQLIQLQNDTILSVEAYYIEDFKTTKEPYNGHYWHYDTEVSKAQISATIYAGDYLIPVKQRGASFLVHTLEPKAYDSFFSWNFFDATLSRKEYFSPYLFEENAVQFLDENPNIRKEFDDKKQKDSKFKSNAYAQLSWIYAKSPWSEASYRRYPVFRYNGKFLLVGAGLVEVSSL